MQKFNKWFAIAATLALLIPAGLWAQSGSTGAITGLAQDEKGGTIPNANVVVINRATGAKVRETTTTTAGVFNITLLPPGTYRVEITAAAGFAKFVADDIVVRVTETTSVTATMKLGMVTETVTVTGAAAVVNLANATTGQTIGSETVASLPLSTGNFLTLLTLSAGANSELFDNASLGRGQVTMNVNGQRPTNNNYQLEGINANDINLPILDNVPLPNPNTIQEFKAQTSLYDASQGRNGGGNIQVNLRSGTSQYHGNAYEFFRNNILNANSWFNNASVPQVPRPVLRQNQFGASFGGPIPFWKDAFFFVNYQGSRAASGASASTFFTTTIPIFPAVRTQATLQAAFFPTGLPTGFTQLDPTALAFLNLPASKCPGFSDGTHCIPTLAGTPGLEPTTGAPLKARITRAATGAAKADQFVVTFDKQLRSKDRISARWFFDNNSTLLPFGVASSLPFTKTLPGGNRFLKAGWTHTFSSNIVNEVRFGFNRFSFAQVPDEPILLTDVGATRANSAQFPAAYRVAVGGGGSFSIGTGVNDNRGGVFNTFVSGDDISITHGKHLFRLGMESSRYQLNRFNNFAQRGSVTFANTVAGDPVASIPALAGLQNWLLGRVTGSQGSAGFSSFHFRALDFGAYLQDDWKIKPRFTLNLGLRWEGLSTAHELNNFLANFAGLEDGTQQIIHIIHPEATPRVGTPGVSSCTLTNCFSWRNFAPRVGFAWDLFGNQKTVLRSGYGVYYMRVSNQSLLQTSGGLPFSQAISAAKFSVTPQNPFPTILPNSAFPLPTDQVVPALTGFNGTTGAPIFAGGAPLSGFFFFPVRDFRPPYTQQWNLTIERQLFKGWVLELGYVGTHAVHLLGTGRPGNPGQICTIAQACAIPSSLGQNINVPAGTPFITKQTDGTILITGSTANNLDARVPVQFLGLANSRGFFQYQDGNSIYHALQATLSHHFSSGLYFQGAYTWSRSIDNSSGSTFSDELNGLFGFGDLQNQRGQRGPSDFDRTHRLSVSYVYELPFAKWAGVSNSGFAGRLLHGWSINGVTTFQSGTPFVVVDSSALTLQDLEGVNGTNFATLASGRTLASALVSGSVQSNINGFLDLSAFVIGGNCVNNQNVAVPCKIGAAANPAVAGRAIGNVGRNSFRGPFQQNWDIAINKNTKITERISIDFRTDFFNAFNHPSFQSPQAAGGSFGNYGYVDVAGNDSSIFGTVSSPRILQFGAKINF
jgi:hypothetical protein